MITVSVMQVAIVKIISVAVVFHGGVPAVWAMHVAVSPRVLLVSVSHFSSPFEKASLVVARRERSGAHADDLVRFHFCVHRFIKFHVDGAQCCPQRGCFCPSGSDRSLIQNADVFGAPGNSAIPPIPHDKRGLRHHAPCSGWWSRSPPPTIGGRIGWSSVDDIVM